MKGHILAIDDSLTIRRLLETAFGRSGYTIDTAASGGEGIALAKRAKPDLVLLDYILPDMKGLEVSDALAATEATRDIPIVIMSAKGETLRSVFKNAKAVGGFLPKPFTAPEAVFLVSQMLRRPAAEEALPARSALDKEAVARAVFSALRDRLALIPEWSGQCGTQNPAAFFGRKILTASAVEAMVSAISPLLETASTPAVSLDERSLMRGHTSLFPLMELLAQLSALSRTGVLQLEHPGRRTFIFFRQGELVLASDDQPEEALRRASAGLPSIDLATREPLVAAQREIGKPAILAYAALAPDLSTLLYEESLRVLVTATQGGPSPFTWTESSLPDWAADRTRTCTLEQIQLSRLREVDDWTQVETQIPSLDHRFARAPQLSKRLTRFSLTGNERRVLTVVNGRNTVRDLIERTTLPTFEVFHTLFRLLQVGLIQRTNADRGTGEIVLSEGPSILIRDGDTKGVIEPLSRMLSKRRVHVPVVRAMPGDGIFGLISRRRPRLVLLNAGEDVDELKRIAESVRGTLEVSDTTLVAILTIDQVEAGLAEELKAAGFDESLVRPFLFSDVERLLAV